MIGKALQRSCDDRKTSLIERCYKEKEKGYSLILEDSAFTREIFTKEVSPEREASPLAVNP